MKNFFQTPNYYSSTLVGKSPINSKRPFSTIKGVEKALTILQFYLSVVAMVA